MEGKILGRAYRVISQLDAGGMGLVYEAEHVRLRRRVAVKIMAAHLVTDEQALARFHREAEIISQLDHPHIVQVLDFDTTDEGQPYLVMEYLRGESLDRRLERSSRLATGEALRISMQAALGLAAAHRSGVVHRDLKPANIFLVDAGDQVFVKLLDFGISKRAGPQSRKLTGEFDILGTPDYMAPEQALGRTALVDHRGDQFALAVITFEMLTGSLPFAADDVMKVLQRVIRDAPCAPSALNPEIPEAVDAVILRGLAKEPEARFESIGAFAEALEMAGLEVLRPSRTGFFHTLPALSKEEATSLAAPAPRDRTPHANATTMASHSQSTPGAVRAPAPSYPDPIESGRTRSGVGASGGGACEPTGQAASTPLPSGMRKRPTSWGKKDPETAVRELIRRARQELGLDNLSLALSYADSALKIAASCENDVVKELVETDASLFERIFERHLGPPGTLLVPNGTSSTGGALSPELAYLLSRVEGGMMVEEAVDMSAWPRRKTLRHLVELKQRGHVRSDRRGRTRPVG